MEDEAAALDAKVADTFPQEPQPASSTKGFRLDGGHPPFEDRSSLGEPLRIIGETTVDLKRITYILSGQSTTDWANSEGT